MLLDAGINRFKCSTIAEAEMLGREGAADVLLAYQPTRLKAKRLARLRQAFPDTVFSCLVDNRLTASVLAELFIDHPLPVFIDLDVGTVPDSPPTWPLVSTPRAAPCQVCGWSDCTLTTDIFGLLTSRNGAPKLMAPTHRPTECSTLSKNGTKSN